mmetsp:Transcript_32897/g.75720  ORF Transcript_32897/g.75720 Transcript_32897/m.75720 type:complete len:216 (-) Transcript_32897:403-1050(-)
MRIMPWQRTYLPFLLALYTTSTIPSKEEILPLRPHQQQVERKRKPQRDSFASIEAQDVLAPLEGGILSVSFLSWGRRFPPCPIPLCLMWRLCWLYLTPKVLTRKANPRQVLEPPLPPALPHVLPHALPRALPRALHQSLEPACAVIAIPYCDRCTAVNYPSGTIRWWCFCFLASCGVFSPRKNTGMTTFFDFLVQFTFTAAGMLPLSFCPPLLLA